jgi:uncharacterized membrane protein YtjA (UPF0391 family)
MATLYAAPGRAVDFSISSHARISPPGHPSPMLKWALIFLVVAVVAGLLGFVGLAGAAADIAKVLFYIFLVFFVLGLIAAIFITKKIF